MESISLQSFASNTSDNILRFTGKCWFVIAFIGQLFLATYVAMLYGSTALQNDFEKWNTVMPHGYIEGAMIGNIVVALHLLMAVLVLVGGPLQIIPQVRKSYPVFHRWNGRIYIANAFIIALAGLYMVWIRGAVGGLPSHLGISLNALLIMLFAYMALKTATQRKFTLHYRWVLRLFLVMSGVWFFRIGMMVWLFINGGPAGFDPETLIGPFITIWTFGTYLLPLIVLEVFFYAQNQPGNWQKMVMALLMIFLIGTTALGVFLATVGMWLPRIL